MSYKEKIAKLKREINLSEKEAAFAKIRQQFLLAGSSTNISSEISYALTKDLAKKTAKDLTIEDQLIAFLLLKKMKIDQ